MDEHLRKSADILKTLASGITYTHEQIGLLGKLDADGSVNPNPADGLDKPYVWVRLNDADQAIRAINMNTTSRIPNLRVRVARDRKMKEWVILGLAPEIVHELPEQAPTYNTPDRISDLITELVDLNRLRGLRVKRGSTTFRVVVENGYYWWQGEFRAWLESNDELDISGDVPGGYGTKRPVLIGIDPDTDSLTSYAGDVVVVTLPPTKGKMFTPDLIEAAVQAAPTNIRWIACIPLTSNDTDWSDPYRVTALQYIPVFDGGQYTLVRDNGVDETQRAAINFVSTPTITLSVNDDAANNESEVSATANPSAILDYKVKVSADDTTADYLLAKLAAGTGITLTETNPAGNEDATIAVNQSQLSLASLGTRAFVNLSDVPSDYTTHGSKLVRVNAGATGLEFVSKAELISFTELSDVSLSSPASGEVPRYSGTLWQNTRLALSDLKEVQQICEGRLSLDSAFGIQGSDKTAQTTLYYHPNPFGNRIALYDGSKWTINTFSSTSIAIPATSDTNYDVFGYVSPSFTLELVAWTNDTSRATALATQDGVYVKSGASTRRYLGTIRTDPTSGQCTHSIARRFVWNYYNRTFFNLAYINSTGHSYASTTIRGWNNDTTFTHTVGWIWGLQEDSIYVDLYGQIRGNADGDTPQLSWGLNTNTAFSTSALITNKNIQGTGYSMAMAQNPRQGYNYLQILEKAASGTGQFDQAQIGAWGRF